MGLDLVRTAVRLAGPLPVVAIGGITLDNAPSVIAAGAASVAVIGDLLAGGDPRRRTGHFFRRLAISRISRIVAGVRGDCGWLTVSNQVDRSAAGRRRRRRGEHTLKRTLGAWSLVSLGIGGIIGAGIFVRTAAAIAERSGPSVTLAFIVAGIGCAFAGLCYAEFASMIPIAGSAYTYSYATMGEFVAWIIGWDLVLEYAVGAATVAIAWSEYFNRVLGYVGHATSRTNGAIHRSRWRIGRARGS